MSPAAIANPPDRNDAISGIVEIDLSDPETAFGVQHSDTFDADETRARAIAEKSDGDFQSAFHDFWAVCETGHAISCLDAAMLADTRIVDQVPVELIQHLYASACAGSITAACRLTAEQD